MANRWTSYIKQTCSPGFRQQYSQYWSDGKKVNRGSKKARSHLRLDAPRTVDLEDANKMGDMDRRRLGRIDANAKELRKFGIQKAVNALLSTKKKRKKGKKVTVEPTRSGPPLTRSNNPKFFTYQTLRAK